MALSIVTEQLKRANKSLGSCLGTGRASSSLSKPAIIAGLHIKPNYLQDKTPAKLVFQQIENERNMLIQQNQQQLQKYADLVQCVEEESDRAIRLHQKEIGRLRRKIKRYDLENDKYLEMLLEWKENRIVDRNEVLIDNGILERDEQISELRNQLSVILKEQHDKDLNINDNSAILNKKIAELEEEIKLRGIKAKALESMLESRTTEINDRDEIVLNKDRQISELRGQLNEKEAKLGKVINSLEKKIKSLEAAVKSRDMKVADLEEMLNNKKTELLDMSRKLLNKGGTEKHDNVPLIKGQLHQNVEHINDKDVESDEILIFLKKKIQFLEKEVDRSANEIKTLEEAINTKNMTINHQKELLIQATKDKDIQLRNLKEELEQTLIQMRDKVAECGRNINSLKETVKRLEKEIKQRDLKIKDLEVVSERKEINSNKMLKEKDDQFSTQSMHMQMAMKKLQDKEIEMNEQVTSLRKKIKHLEAEASNRALKGSERTGVKDSKKSENKDIQPNNNEMESTVLKLKEKLQQALSRLKDTEAELDETRTRLSKTMGDRLTDNNPNIVDLSDKNRPNKLAERFSELYDNQWTDAFDILTHNIETEENTVEALLKILQESMSFCRTKGQEQMEELQRVLEFSDKHKQASASKDTHKLLKDCRKAVAPDAVGNLYQYFVSHLQSPRDKTLRRALNVPSYTTECLEICWLMSIQDPPVVFAPLLQKGSRFNTDLFKPYTSSGTEVDYVVWPALLLYEDGPILAKGIAQGLVRTSGKDK